MHGSETLPPYHASAGHGFSQGLNSYRELVDLGLVRDLQKRRCEDVLPRYAVTEAPTEDRLRLAAFADPGNECEAESCVEVVSHSCLPTQ